MRIAANAFALAIGLLALLPAGTVAAAEQDEFEDRSIRRCAERSAQRQFQATKSERAQWLKVMEATYPDKVNEKITGASKDEDYGAWFDLLAGKSGEWRRDEAPSPQVAELYDRALRRLELGPVPSIKRDEFIRFARRSLDRDRDRNRDRDRDRDRNSQPEFSDEADRVFRVLDRDASGELQAEEYTLSLREQRGRADADGNGRITKEEYRDYFKGRVEARVGEFAAKFGGDALAKPGDDKPGANGLPAWFSTLDVDKDGQVALFEWRDGSKPLNTFRELDLDGDGLLTSEEYQRYLKKNEDALKQKKREDGRP